MMLPTPASDYSYSLTVPQQLAHRLHKAEKSQLTGRLNFYFPQIFPLELCFVSGRLIWARGGEHHCRRWHRLLLHIAPQIDHSSFSLESIGRDTHSEFRFLRQLLDTPSFTWQQALTLSERLIREVLFEIILSFHHIDQFCCLHEQLTAPFSSPDIQSWQALLDFVEKQWQVWCHAQLTQHSPNLSPKVTQPQLFQSQTTPETYEKLTQFLQGQFTLRELAPLLNQDLVLLTQSLVHYEQQGWLEFLACEDHISTNYDSLTLAVREGSAKAYSTSTPSPSSQKPFVLCVDDNARCCEDLGQLIEQAGCRFEGLSDPMKALEVAIERKPDLIFLDLVMPRLSGYDLCYQLRRTSLLRKTPIIILSSRDKIAARVRGKILGANAYLAKPATAGQVISTLQRWLTAPPDRWLERGSSTNEAERIKLIAQDDAIHTS